MKKLDGSEYLKRRQSLIQRLGDNSAIVLASGREKIRNADTHFPFRVDSDFYYVTGFDEPDAIFVLRPGTDIGASILFCRPRDPAKEQWDGYRLGPEQAPSELSIAKAFDIAEIDTKMPELLNGVENFYYPIGRYDWLDRAVGRWQRTMKSKARAGVRAPQTWADVDRLIHSMRSIKTAAEIEQMSVVAQITAEAHQRAMSIAVPGIWEYQLSAVLTYEFMHQGCQAAAYPSIVAGGNNANILHYVTNNQQIEDGALVLIDAGGELDGYAADVTRTFPINGRFSEAQRQVYEIVLDAQLQAIDVIKPGVAFDQFHKVAVKVLVEGLHTLGLLEGNVEESIENEVYKRFYMHRTGHFLGMDVHDVGSYKDRDKWHDLKPGMVVTVEPGLYIPDAPDIPEQYRGIGIRIEDDIVVTAKGNQNLTLAAPKTIDDIEQLMANAKQRRLP